MHETERRVGFQQEKKALKVQSVQQNERNRILIQDKQEHRKCVVTFRKECKQCFRPRHDGE